MYDNHTLNSFYNFTGDWKVWDTIGGVGGLPATGRADAQAAKN